MWKTIVRRLLILIPQVLVLSLLVFVMAEFMPGDALTGNIDPDISAEQLELIREKMGLNDPWYQRYGRWLGNALQGDLGTSTAHKQPVVKVIGNRFANTARLAVFAVILTYLIAIPLGILSGRYDGSFFDRVVNLYTYTLMSVPTVILGLLFIFFFVFRLRLFPMGGSVDVAARGTWGVFKSHIHHMVLPGLTLALVQTPNTITYLRNEIIQNKASDFVTTARSKGVPERVIYNKHILRNSFIPIASSLGATIAALLSGAQLTETVFQYPGMGRLFIDSIELRDFPVVTAVVIIFALLIVLGNLFSDILLTIVDPRIRIE